MEFVNIDTLPTLSSLEDDAVIILQGCNGEYYRTTKKELTGIPDNIRVDSIEFTSQSGVVTLKSSNTNTGGYTAFLPATPNEGGEEHPHCNINTNDLVFESETAPTISDAPVSKRFFVWKKPSTGECWLCTFNGTTLLKVQFT